MPRTDVKTDKRKSYTVHGRPESATAKPPEPKRPDVQYRRNGSDKPVLATVLFQFHDDGKVSVSIDMERDENGKRAIPNRKLVHEIGRAQRWMKGYGQYLRQNEKAQ